MDGRGRCLGNIFIERLWRSLNYETVYLHSLTDGFVAERIIGDWIASYRAEKPHSAHDGRTPAEAYRAGRRGSSPIGRYVMAMAGHRELCDSRESCTVLEAPGGEIPSGDSTEPPICDLRRHSSSTPRQRPTNERLANPGAMALDAEAGPSRPNRRHGPSAEVALQFVRGLPLDQLSANWTSGFAAQHERCRHSAEPSDTIHDRLKVLRCRHKYLQNKTILAGHAMDFDDVRHFAESLEASLDVLMRRPQSDNSHQPEA
jgi:Integrase core domain